MVYSNDNYRDKNDKQINISYDTAQCCDICSKHPTVELEREYWNFPPMSIELCKECVEKILKGFDKK